MATEVGKGYVALEADSKNLQGQLTNLGSVLGGKMGPIGQLLGAKLGGSMGQEMQGQLGGSKSGVLQLAGLLGKGGPWGIAAGAAVAGAAAIGVGLYKLGGSFEEQYRTIARATGATGTDLQSLEQSFKAVAKTTPASFGEISQAIIGMQRYTGPTSTSLNGLSTQILTLSRITKTDAKTNVESFTHAMEAWQIPAKNAGPAMDAMFRASQKSGVSFSELSGSVTKFTPALKTMGYSFNDGVSAVAQWSKEGLNVPKVMQGMQLGSTNIVKGMGKSSGAMQKAEEQVAKYEAALAKAKPGSAAYQTASENLAKAQDKLSSASADVAKGAGVSIPDAMKKAIKGIQDAKDPQDALNLAIETFGKKAAPTMVEAISSGKFNFDEMSKSVEGSNNAIKDTAKQTATVGGSFGKLGNQAKVGLEPISTATFKGVNRGLIEMANGLSAAIAWLPHLGEAWKDAYSFVSMWTRRIYEAIKPLRDVIGSTFTTMARLMMDAWHVVEPLFKLYIDAFKAIWDILHGDWGAAGRAVWDMVKDIVRAVQGIPKLLFDYITAPFASLGPGIADALGSFWDTVSGIPTKVIDFLANLGGDIVNLVTTAFGLVVGAAETGISGLWGWVTGIAGRVVTAFANLGGAIWGALVGGFQQAVNGAEAGIGGLWGMVSGVAGRVGSGLANIGSSIWNALSTGFGEAVKGAENGLTTLWSKLSGLGTDIKNAVPDLGSVLYEAGKTVIASLARGITEAIPGALGSAMSGVGGFITSHLPHSPAKRGPLSGAGDPLKSGLALTNRLAAGINSGAPTVSMAMTDLLAVPMSVPSLTGGTTAAGAGAASYGGPSVVIQEAHFHDQLDVEAFMKKASWVVQTQRI